MADNSNEILIQLGKNLQAIRLQKGYTLRDLEGLSDIDNGKISKMESGETNITVITLLRLAKALNTPAAVLLDGLEIGD